MVLEMNTIHVLYKLNAERQNMVLTLLRMKVPNSGMN